MTDLEKAKIAAWDELKEIATDNFESNGRVNIEAGHLMRGWIKELEQKHLPPPKLEPVPLASEVLSSSDRVFPHFSDSPQRDKLRDTLGLLAAQIERDILKKLGAK